MSCDAQMSHALALLASNGPSPSLFECLQGESRPEPEVIHSGVRVDSKESKHNDKSNADGTATIVLTFVGCVLVAVTGFA